jgi:hypothetical protein
MEGIIRSSCAPIIPHQDTVVSRIFDLDQCKKFTTERVFSVGFYINIEELLMTQHLSPADTLADQRAMRQLATVVGFFIVGTAIMALAVGLIMG